MLRTITFQSFLGYLSFSTPRFGYSALPPPSLAPHLGTSQTATALAKVNAPFGTQADAGTTQRADAQGKIVHSCISRLISQSPRHPNQILKPNLKEVAEVAEEVAEVPTKRGELRKFKMRSSRNRKAATKCKS